MPTPVIVNLESQNSIIIPVALAVGQAPPATISDQKWLLKMSGVAVFQFEGSIDSDWAGATLSIYPDVLTPLQYATQSFSIQTPHSSQIFINPGFLQDGMIIPVFHSEQITMIAGLNSVFNAGGTAHAGFSVNDWRPIPTNLYGPVPVSDLPFGIGPIVGTRFHGVEVDVAVRGNGAILYRLGFEVSLVGTIIFAHEQDDDI